MKAMILAAGYGTRLKPLTDEKPKALIEIQNIPLLELIIKKLIATGVSEIIINSHHFAEQIVHFIQKNNSFGIRIEFSHEPEILGTGGGLKKVSYFFNNDQSFFLHNVDILSTINLAEMYQYHLDKNAMVTLAVQKRSTNRYLIVDDQNYICGHEDTDNKRTRLKRIPTGKSSLKAFCGIHIISPKIFNFLEESGRFSVIDVYLKLIEQGLPIIGFPADEFYWKDIGKLETLDEIKHDLNNGIVQFETLIGI
ncbi:MAG: nucleotidyltransferase family protein [bacterium]|nr:MAG: nucleotidyltransferase family protein [bacterium]